MFKKIFIIFLFIFISFSIQAGENNLKLDFENAPLEDIIRAISIQSSLNIVLGQNTGMDAKTNFTEPLYLNIHLSDVTPYDALWTICNSLNLRLYKYGNVYFIENPQLISSTPKYLKLTTETIDIGDIDAVELQNTVSSIISKDGKFSIYDQAKSLVITDYQENIKKIKQITNDLKYNNYKNMISEKRKIFQKKQKINYTDGKIYWDSSKSDTLTVEEYSRAIESIIHKSIIIKPEDKNTAVDITINGLEPLESLKEVVKALKTSMNESSDKIFIGKDFLNTEVIKLFNVPLYISPLKSGDAALGGGEVSGNITSMPREDQPTEAQIVSVLKQILRDITPSGITSNLNADVKTNSIIITSTFYVIDQFKNIVKKLDKPKEQILIEAYFLKVNTDVIDRLGINWTLTNNGGLPLYTGTVDLSKAADFAEEYTNNATIQGNIMNWSVTNMIEALVTETKAKILSRPRVLVLDNEMASMAVVSNAWYVESQDVTVANGTTNTSTNVSEITNIGIILRVTPRVKKKSMINLEIQPIVRTLQGHQTLNGIDYPLIASEQASTVLDVKNEHTIVIGGLLKEEKTDEKERTPGLSKIPIIGNLFKRKNNEKQNQELIIFVTPRIVGKGIMEREVTNTGQRDESVNKIYSKPVLKEPY